MKDILNNNYLGISPLSGTHNISYYTSTPNNIQELGDQESQSNQNDEGETPQLNIKISQNTKRVENKEKDNNNEINEIPGNKLQIKFKRNCFTGH